MDTTLKKIRKKEFYIHPPCPSLAEDEVLDYIDSLSDGDVIYDLGACQGVFSFYAALNGLKCYSFEPEPKNFKRFQHLIAVNTKLHSVLPSRLKAYNCGVGSHNHAATMKVDMTSSAGTWRYVTEEGWQDKDGIRKDIRENLSRPGILDKIDTITVDIVSLDEFIKTNGLPMPNHMKIDIDGSEAFFIDGARGVFGSDSLKSVIFELNIKDTHFNRIIEFLRINGFKERTRHRIKPNPDLYNIIFFKR